MKCTGGHQIANVTGLDSAKQLRRVHFDAVPLGSPNVRAGLIQSEAPLGVVPDNVQSRDTPTFWKPSNQPFGDHLPTLVPDLVRVVPRHLQLRYYL